MAAETFSAFAARTLHFMLLLNVSISLKHVYYPRCVNEGIRKKESLGKIHKDQKTGHEWKCKMSIADFKCNKPSYVVQNKPAARKRSGLTVFVVTKSEFLCFLWQFDICCQY